MHKLEKIISWASSKENISALMLTGSLASQGLVDDLSDYDIAVYGKNFDFIKTNKWLDEIEGHLVCVNDKFNFYGYEIPTRLTIFNPYFKVDFSFHPLDLLNKIIDSNALPDEYNIGYQILLDKQGLAAKLLSLRSGDLLLKSLMRMSLKKMLMNFGLKFIMLLNIYPVVIYGQLWLETGR